MNKISDKMIGALSNFRNAALRLTETWAEVENGFVGVEDYPSCLDSFDEFALQVDAWVQTQVQIYNKQQVEK